MSTPQTNGFAAFAARMQQGGTLDDDFPDMLPGGGAISHEGYPAGGYPKPQPWWTRLSNWLLEVFSDD